MIIKKTIRISILLLTSITMVAGVGLLNVSNATKASAEETVASTQTLTITRDSFSQSGGYGWYSWSEQTSGGTSISGRGELFTTCTDSMQFNITKGANNAAVFNTTAIPGQITKIEATAHRANVGHSWSAYVSSSAFSVNSTALVDGLNKTTVGSEVTIDTTRTSLGTSDKGYSYFCIQEAYSGASYLSEIVITYTVPTPEPGETPITSIKLGGAITNNCIGICSNDSYTYTAEVNINSDADDKHLVISHLSGTEGLVTLGGFEGLYGYIRCKSDGIGTFTISGTGATTGAEVFRISACENRKMYVDLVVNALIEDNYYYDVYYYIDEYHENASREIIEENGHPTFPTFKKEGYIFDGWQLDPEGTGPYYTSENASTYTVTRTVSFYAHWTLRTSYQLYTDVLEDGDYLIVDPSTNMALKSELTSNNRLAYETVNPQNSKINNPDESIVWHIAFIGGYWTIYNESVSKYLQLSKTSSTGSLVSGGGAQFVIEGAYDFKINGTTRYLRYNPGYGFGSYAASTGSTLSLYRSLPDGPTGSFVEDSLEGYVGQTIEVNYTLENFEDEDYWDIYILSSSEIAIDCGVTETDITGGYFNFLLKDEGITTLSLVFNEEVLDTITLSISYDIISGLGWTSIPEIDVFSDTTLTSEDYEVWKPRYIGEHGARWDIKLEDASIMLGGSEISLPYTLKAEDDGKQIWVECGGFSTSKATISVTQTINPVYTHLYQTHTRTWTASSASEFGNPISEVNVPDIGNIYFDDGSNVNCVRYLRRIDEGGADSISMTEDGYIKFGNPTASEEVWFQTTNSEYTTKIEIECWTDNDQEMSLSVLSGGQHFGSIGYVKIPSSPGNKLTFVDPDPKVGPVDIIAYPKYPSSAYPTFYIKSFTITTIETYEGDNISNVIEHKSAQRVAVDFAKAFNSAMDSTKHCTTNMYSAWEECQVAYNAFKTNAAALGEAEEIYAKELIRRASITEEWPEEYSQEACIERMMKVYETCVTKHGMSAFMSDLAPSIQGLNGSTIINLLSSHSSYLMPIILIAVVCLSSTFVLILVQKKKRCH